MPTQGITQRYRLSATQQVAASAALVAVTAAGSGAMSFPVKTGQKIHFRIAANFTIGATGGFKFRLVPPAATTYNNVQTVTDGVTASPGNIIAAGIVAAADFANALAVAGTHKLEMEGDLVPSADGTLSLQMACNSAANAIDLLVGAYMEVTIL